MSRHYRDLVAWQRAMDLVSAIYEITERFPKREMYSLCDQIRRAAVSIPSNIAEGQAQFNRREFLHFLRDAQGSLAELETQILIAERLKYVVKTDIEKLLNKSSELGRIPNGLINSLKKQVDAAA